jgi:hypothetical protein
MTADQERKLRSASRIGKQVRFKNKKEAGHRIVGVVEDEVYIIVSDYKHMIQRIKFADGQGWSGNQYAYRVAYYTWDAGMKSVKWGQYHSLLAESELKSLIYQAKEKGWKIF